MEWTIYCEITIVRGETMFVVFVVEPDHEILSQTKKKDSPIDVYTENLKTTNLCIFPNPRIKVLSR